MVKTVVKINSRAELAQTRNDNPNARIVETGADGHRLVHDPGYAPYRVGPLTTSRTAS